MHCLSCHRPLTSTMCNFWKGVEDVVVVCKTCLDVANAAKAELEVRSREALHQALFALEQRLIDGFLLEAPRPPPPGLGEVR